MEVNEYYAEIVYFECYTCGTNVDFIIGTDSDIDACIDESGHAGHRYQISGYEVLVGRMHENNHNQC